MKLPLGVVILVFLVGGILGVLLSPVANNLIQNQAIADLSKTTGVGFERCAGLPQKESVSCADDLLREEAVRKQDRTVCAKMSDMSMQKDCVARLDRLAKLGNVATICAGISSDSNCVDLMSILSASEHHDIATCASISQPLLAKTCNDLLSGAAAMTDAGAKVFTSNYHFGLACDTSAEDCVKQKKSFISAVKSGDSANCKNVTLNPSLCEMETLLYKAYTSGNISACEKVLSKDQCTFETTLAKALDAGDATICKSLSAQLRMGCEQTASVLKEKRFDYLNETF